MQEVSFQVARRLQEDHKRKGGCLQAYIRRMRIKIFTTLFMFALLNLLHLLGGFFF